MLAPFYSILGEVSILPCRSFVRNNPASCPNGPKLEILLCDSVPGLVRFPDRLIHIRPIVPDGAGDLRPLEVMPTRYSTSDTIVNADWSQLFAMAGLDMDRFSETRPRYQRFMTPDRRRTWIGTVAERPEVELRVEAGSYEGRPVLFDAATPEILSTLTALPAVGQSVLDGLLGGGLHFLVRWP